MQEAVFEIIFYQRNQNLPQVIMDLSYKKYSV